MRNVLKPAVLMLSGALGAVALAGPATAQFGPPPNLRDMVNHNPILYADLDDGGPGQFTGVLDPATNQLCYMINVPGMDATAAHIHVGTAGQDGAPVVPLATPKGGASGACATLKPDIAKALVSNPAGYYVNVHTAAYPMGATRGQLKVYDPNKK